MVGLVFHSGNMAISKIFKNGYTHMLHIEEYD
jgi:hypothetical protein